MAYATVPCGAFLGWTRAQILTRQAILRTELQNRAAGSGLLTSASLNGKSFTYDVRAAGAWSVQEEMALLQEALALVDDDVPAVTSEQTFSAR